MGYLSRLLSGMQNSQWDSIVPWLCLMVKNRDEKLRWPKKVKTTNHFFAVIYIYTEPVILIFVQVTGGGYTCLCVPQCTGQNCESCADPCAPPNPCFNGGACTVSCNDHNHYYSMTVHAVLWFSQKCIHTINFNVVRGYSYNNNC